MKLYKSAVSRLVKKCLRIERNSYGKNISKVDTTTISENIDVVKNI